MTATRPFTTDHHHIAGADFPGVDCRECVLLSIENARRPAMTRAFVAGDFHHAAVGREISAKDDKAAGGPQRRRKGADDLLP